MTKMELFDLAYDATKAEALRLTGAKEGTPRFARVHARLMREWIRWTKEVE